jgi:general secretion pathway protein L
MSSLFVLLAPGHATAQTEFPYALSSDRRSVASHGSAPAALLPQPTGAGAEVVAIVPAAALSWHQVELPKGTSAGSPRLRAVLEGLLEDRLLDEPDTLHFALQPRPPATGPAWVAVCDRAWLRSAVQVLEGAGRPASRIVPEFAPEGQTALYALGEPEDASLVMAGQQGVFTLPLASASLALLPSLPQEAPRVAEPAVAALAEQVLQQKLELQQAPQRWLQAAQSGWDLAQSDFASSNRARALKKLAGGWAEILRAPQWRPARWGAALLLAVNLIGVNAWAWKERSALEAKRAAVRGTLTQAFPHIKVVVDAPVQMEREVAALRQVTGGTSGRDLESMLAALTFAVPPGRSIANLEYSGNELRVRGLATGAEDARAVASGLKSLGYAATVQGDTLLVRPEAAP